MRIIIGWRKNQECRKLFDTLEEALLEAEYILTNESTKYIYEDTYFVTFYKEVNGRVGVCLGCAFLDVHGNFVKSCTLNKLELETINNG